MYIIPGVHSTVKMTSDQTKSSLKLSTSSPTTTHAYQPSISYSIIPTLLKTSVNKMNLTSPKPSSTASTTTLYTPSHNLYQVNESTETTKFTTAHHMLTYLSASTTYVPKQSSPFPKTISSISTSLMKTTSLSQTSTKSFITKSTTSPSSILTTIKTFKTTTVLAGTGTGTTISRQTVQSNPLSPTTITTQTSDRNLDNITTPFATDNEKIKEEGIFGKSSLFN